MPEAIRGTGTETNDAHGYYGKRKFVAHGGLVLFHRDQSAFEVILFPEPVPCDRWYRGTPAGISLDIDVYASGADLRSIPVGRPLSEYDVDWAVDHGNETALDYSWMHFDGTSQPGSVTLTAIETAPGGFWRKKIATAGVRTSGDVPQRFSGTFAAQWCNIDPH